MPFRSILKIIGFDELFRIYPAMHTVSEERCVAYVLDLMNQHDMENRLQFYRQRLGLTQKELAERANVNLRTLQQYEIGGKDLRKASAMSVINLAQVLGCRPEELLCKE